MLTGGYQGDEAQLGAFEASRNAITEVKRTDKEVNGIVVLPKRWVVETTFGWINRARCLSKDFEATMESALAWLQIAVALIVMRRLARGKSATGDLACYFIDMRLYSFSVLPWRCDSRARFARRANRPEQIGVLVAPFGRLARPCPGSRPWSDYSVLLVDPGFIVDPGFNRHCLRRSLNMCAQRARNFF